MLCSGKRFLRLALRGQPLSASDVPLLFFMVGCMYRRSYLVLILSLGLISDSSIIKTDKRKTDPLKCNAVSQLLFPTIGTKICAEFSLDQRQDMTHYSTWAAMLCMPTHR